MAIRLLGRGFVFSGRLRVSPSLNAGASIFSGCQKKIVIYLGDGGERRLTKFFFSSFFKTHERYHSY